VGRLGLEPRTHGLKVRCSTIELTPLGLTRALTCSFLLYIASVAAVPPQLFWCHSFGTAWPLPALPATPWQLALESDNKKSQDDYLASVRSLATFLAANDMPGQVDDVTTEGVRALVLSGRKNVLAESPSRQFQIHKPLGRR
jgi:hypothetical protein